MNMYMNNNEPSNFYHLCDKLNNDSKDSEDY